MYVVGGRTDPAGVARAWDEWRSGKDKREAVLGARVLAYGSLDILMASEMILVLFRKADAD